MNTDSEDPIHNADAHAWDPEGANASTPACCGNVACETCQSEVPISEAKSAEAVDYVAYFCGFSCYQKWLSAGTARRTTGRT